MASLLDVYSRNDNKSREYLLLRSQLQHYWNRNNVAAIASIEEALKLYGEDDELLSFAIELASSTGSKINGFSAGDLAEKILSQNPDNQFALRVMAETLINEQRWNEAYDMCKSFIEKPDASLESYFNFIDVCIELKKNDEAWNTVASLYNEKSDNEAVIQEYIKVLIAIGKKDEASSLIDSLIVTSSSKMKSFLYYERSFIVKSDDEIFASLRSSLTSNPRNSDSLFRLYSIYLEKKDYRKAQYYLKQVVALNPSNERYLKLNSELELLINR
ncbi:MAG: hypothetical protein K6F69_05205 [Treponema sp.]|nr:hypothetical protein [Treponema sp.]